MYHLRLCNHVHKACLHSECSTGILEVAGPEHTHNYFIIRCLINKAAGILPDRYKAPDPAMENSLPPTSSRSSHCAKHPSAVSVLCSVSTLLPVHIPVKCRENRGACRGFAGSLLRRNHLRILFQFFDIVYMVVIAKCRNCLRCWITKPAGRSVLPVFFSTVAINLSTVHVSFPPYLLLLLISQGDKFLPYLTRIRPLLCQEGVTSAVLQHPTIFVLPDLLPLFAISASKSSPSYSKYVKDILLCCR